VTFTVSWQLTNYSITTTCYCKKLRTGWQICKSSLDEKSTVKAANEFSRKRYTAIAQSEKTNLYFGTVDHGWCGSWWLRSYVKCSIRLNNASIWFEMALQMAIVYILCKQIQKYTVNPTNLVQCQKIVTNSSHIYIFSFERYDKNQKKPAKVIPRQA